MGELRMTVDDYLAELDAEQRAAMEQIRSAIRSVVPDASEVISYRMPAFKHKGRMFLWCAAFRDHYSIYPYSEGLIAAVGEEITPHISGKGTLRFEIHEPVPVELIKKIAAARLAEADSTYRR